MAKGFRRGKSQKGSKQSDVGEWMEDDADDRGATALPGEGEGEDESEESDEEQGVMDVKAAEESDDEEDEGEGEEDDDEDHDEMIRRIKQQQKLLRENELKRKPDEWEGLDEEEGEEADDEEATIAPRWGGKKEQYYGGDEAGVELQGDEEAEEEEENEALRMQEEAARRYGAEDYAPGWNLKENDEDEHDDDEADEDERDQVVTEAVSGDATKELTPDERAATIKEETPELAKLLNELRSSLEELRGRVQPALDEVRNGMRPTKGGISYLEAKHLLLLSYCQNLAFYLLLKLEGREVRDHPVMERLVEIRTYLEKAKPIDKRMQHQIDRVIRIAKSADAPKPKQADGEEDESDEGELDDLAYRPNPEALVPKETEQDTDAAYRPPKLAPAAPVDEPSVAREKAERETAEATRRAHRSRLVRELEQEVKDKPEEEQAGGPDEMTEQQRREAEKLAERAQEEEDKFTRVPLSKEEKKKARSLRRKVGMSTQLSDFGDDVSDLVRMAQRSEKNADESVASLAALHGLHGEGKKKKRNRSGEEDVPLTGNLAERRAEYDRALAKRDAKKRNEQGQAEEVQEDELYRRAEERQRAKKAKKESPREGRIPQEEEEATGKRAITQEMAVNKGLTPHRKKEDKNPRKRLRRKHRKALVKRRGQVPDMRSGSSLGYGGEPSGIKKRTAKSRRLAS